MVKRWGRESVLLGILTDEIAHGGPMVDDTCCAQQTGAHRLIVEALLDHLST